MTATAIRPQWTITKDHIASNAAPGTNGNAVTMVGPRNANLTHEEIINHPQAKAFRMLDDDGELYYEGFAINCDFEPLDHFGTPNAGATSIEYLENGGWKRV